MMTSSVRTKRSERRPVHIGARHTGPLTTTTRTRPAAIHVITHQSRAQHGRQGTFHPAPSVSFNGSEYMEPRTTTRPRTPVHTRNTSRAAPGPLSRFEQVQASLWSFFALTLIITGIAALLAAWPVTIAFGVMSAALAVAGIIHGALPSRSTGRGARAGNPQPSLPSEEAESDEDRNLGPAFEQTTSFTPGADFGAHEAHATARDELDASVHPVLSEDATDRSPLASCCG